jgi:carboxymethylenebutenolidase
MKNVLLLFVLALSACQYAEPASNLAMCHDPNVAIAEFSLFANDKNFRDAHPAPLPVAAFADGKMIEFPVAGGPNGKGFLMTSKKKTNKYLLLFHEWWGLNDYIKNEAAMWCKDLNINVLAIDLYDGKVATTADEAGKIMQANDAARSSAIILGAAKHLGDNANFRTMGWCFGGGWSLQAALLLKDKAKACVMYYGMPEKDVEKLKALNCEVLMIHPTQDQWITADVVSTFEANMKSAGKKLSVNHYDANHAFANPSSPRYNEAHAKEARVVTKAFLKKR